MATSTPVPAPAAPPAGARRLRALRARLRDPRTWIVGGAIAIVALLVLVPLAYLFRDTFTGSSGLSFAAFSRAYGGDGDASGMLVNSVVFAAGSAAVSLVLGTVLAYVQVRTDAPFKGLFFAASLVPLIIPGILYAVAWIFLADPQVGLLNTLLLEPLTGAPRLDVFGMGGMIWVQGLHFAPVAFLLMVAAFRAVDPSLEESALMSGAPLRTVIRRITLPVLRPALVAGALLLFVQSLESFEVPALLGLQDGVYVFTSRIYLSLQSYPIDYGSAGAYAITLLAIASAGVLLGTRLTRNAGQFQTITGKAFRPRLVQLGRARRWVGAAVVLYFVVTVVLPVLVLVYASLLRYYAKPSAETLGSLSLHNYSTVLHTDLAVTAFRNSLLLGVGAGAIVMALTSVIAWTVVRTRARGRTLLDLLTFLPIVIPGLVLGLALSFVWLRSSLPVYGTLLILLIAYATKFLPYGMRYAAGAMAQTSAELEESATVAGASWWQTFRRVLVPLASSGILVGFVYILIVSFRELSSAILLYSPGQEVVSVLLWEQFENGQLTTVAAIGVVMIAILVALVLVAYRLGARFGLESANDR